MDEEKEWVGKWYLPDSPQNKVDGTLKYSPIKGMRLEIMGSIFESRTDMWKPIDVVLGDVAYDNEITLIDCFLGNSWGFQIHKPELVVNQKVKVG